VGRSRGCGRVAAAKGNHDGRSKATDDDRECPQLVEPGARGVDGVLPRQSLHPQPLLAPCLKIAVEFVGEDNRCGTTHTALRPSPTIALSAAIIPITVLPAPVGAATITCPQPFKICGEAWT
jgi:hypothetical protein